MTWEHFLDLKSRGVIVDITEFRDVTYVYLEGTFIRTGVRIRTYLAHPDCIPPAKYEGTWVRQ